MVNLQAVQIGLSNYFDNEILVKATPLKQFGYGFIKGALLEKMETMITQYAENPIIQSLGLIQGDQIDIDSAYRWSKQSIQKSGQIVLMGIIFDEKDTDKLYNYITNAQGAEVSYEHRKDYKANL